MSFFHALLSLGGGGNALLISGSSLDILNRYVDVSFDPNVYHSTGGALLAADLQLIFVQNGGVATACSISSITNTSGGALVGGENIVRVNLSFTGNPSGVETIQIKAAAAGAYKDSFGNYCSANDTTGAITVELELDPLYKAGILLALNNSYTPPVRAQRLVDNALFTGWRTDGVLLEWDALYLFTCNNNFSRINFMSGTVMGAFTGTVTITQFSGGLASSGGYFSTGWDPLTNGVKFLQNDSSMWVGIGIDGQTASIMTGTRGSSSGVNFGHTRIQGRTTGDVSGGAININNSGNAFAPAVTNAIGLHGVSREASNLSRYYKDGSQLTTAATASSTVSDKDFFVWSENGNGTPTTSNVTHEGMLWAAGSGQQDKITEINSRFQTWKTNTKALIPSIIADKFYSWTGQSNGDRAEPLSELSASDYNTYVANGAYLMANGYQGNCYIWWDDEWQPIEPGINSVDKTAGGPYFSPLFAFCIAEMAKYPGEDLYFIHECVGGAGLKNSLLQNNWIPGGVPSASWNVYLSEYNAAIAALTSVTTFMPMYWFQGEADATDATRSSEYEANEQTFVSAVFANTSHDNLIVMQIHTDLPITNYPYKATVRTAKSNNNGAGVYGPLSDFISIDDLARQPADPAHLTNESSITLGQRMSAAYP